MRKEREKIMQIYKRKTKQTGSSIQATIPAEIARKLELEPGDTVVYKVNDNGKVLVEKNQTLSEELGVSEEFTQALHEGMDEYQQALELLVER